MYVLYINLYKAIEPTRKKESEKETLCVIEWE